MNKLVSCVVRNLDGCDELVRIEDSFNHKEGERVITGRMFPCEVNVGPSRSHRLTVWTRGSLTLETLFGEVHEKTPAERFLELESRIARAQNTPVGQALADPTRNVSCVFRSFNGRSEMVRVEDAVGLTAGETVVSGPMVASTIKSGPSRSHTVRVWSRRGPVVESQYVADKAPVAVLAIHIDAPLSIERIRTEDSFPAMTFGADGHIHDLGEIGLSNPAA